MALPLTGITTTIVSQAIGLASNNVGELCIRAASGGVMTTTETPNFNSAFMVAENGGTDGVMIDGSKPYFNIFSTNAPGYWYKTGSNIKYRLKNSGPDQSKLYGFSLGNYRGYNHDAIPLSWGIGAAWYQAENKVKFTGMLTAGDYDWLLVMSEQYGIIPAVNIYDASGLQKQLTLYAGEAYSVNVDEYYFYGELDASRALSYVCRVGFVTLRADGTPGTTAYTFQESGWFNPTGVSQAATIYPTDVPTTATFGIDIPYYLTIADDTIRVARDPNNVYYTRISVAFKCFDYKKVPIEERTRTISVTAINPVTHETLYVNHNFGTYTLKSNNTFSITIPIYYTEMNQGYGLALI